MKVILIALLALTASSQVIGVWKDRATLRSDFDTCANACINGISSTQGGYVAQNFYDFQWRTTGKSDVDVTTITQNTRTGALALFTTVEEAVKQGYQDPINDNCRILGDIANENIEEYYTAWKACYNNQISTTEYDACIAPCQTTLEQALELSVNPLWAPRLAYQDCTDDCANDVDKASYEDRGIANFLITNLDNCMSNIGGVVDRDETRDDEVNKNLEDAWECVIYREIFQNNWVWDNTRFNARRETARLSCRNWCIEHQNTNNRANETFKTWLSCNESCEETFHSAIEFDNGDVVSSYVSSGSILSLSFAIVALLFALL